MTGYSGSREEDVDYAMREAEHEPPIEMLLSEEELAERDRDFEQIAEELTAEQYADEEAQLAGEFKAKVALTLEDSTMLRQRLATIYDAIDTFVLESQQYSANVARMLSEGDGAKTVRYMLDAREERTRQFHTLQLAMVTEWRAALLMSADMTPTNLAYWLPEYAEQLQEPVS